METVLSKRRRDLRESLRQSALDRLSLAAAALYEKGAEAVYAFGSVVHPSKFDERSDVDIAVRGIPEEMRYDIVRMLEDIFAEFPFDVVFLEDDIRHEVRERIEKEGVLWKR